MPTKIYLPSTGAPPVTPSTWNFPNIVNPLTFAGVTTKIPSALTSKTEATGTTSPIFRAMLRYVIGPLSGQTIAGTISLVMRDQESNAGANATLAIAVKIIKPDGTDRAVLLAYTASDSATSPYEMTTSLVSGRAYNVSEVYPIPLTSQAATSGDYLVIEIGFRSATTVSRNITLRYGDASANDLTDGTGESNDYNPWAIFSQIITFIVDYPLNAASGSYGVSGMASGALVGRMISALLGGYNLSGQNASPLAGRALLANPDSYNISGSITSLFANWIISALPASYNLTGMDVNPLAERIINGDPGGYAVTGVEANVLVGRMIEAILGSYTLTGFDAELIYTVVGVSLNAETGSYVMTNFQTGLFADRVLNVENGIYVIGGIDASIIVSRMLTSDPGTYVLSGQAAITLIERLIIANPSSYSVTGFNAVLSTLINYLLSLESGSYVIIGSSARALLEVDMIIGANPTDIANAVWTHADAQLLISCIKNRKYLKKEGSTWYLIVRDSGDLTDILKKALKDKAGNDITDINAGILTEELTSII